jgi:hypothetical protein
MAKRKRTVSDVPYHGGNRKRWEPPPSTEQVDTMTDKADAVEATQEPAKGQKGVASPLRVLHKIQGVTPSQYRELFKQMIGDSVINTYATFAELIAEKRGDTLKASYRRRVPGEPYEVSAEDRDERGALVVPARGSKKAKKTAAKLRARSGVEKKETEAGHISKEYMEKEPFAERTPASWKYWKTRRSPKGHPKMQETRPMRAKRKRGERAAEIQHRKENKAATAKKEERDRFTKDLGDAFDPQENS